LKLPFWAVEIHFKSAIWPGISSISSRGFCKETHWFISASFSGWWYTYPSEKYEFVSWDDDSPHMMGKKIQMFQNHQSDFQYSKTKELRY